MGKVKEVLIKRQEMLRNLIREMVSYEDREDYDEIIDAWCELGLPYDEDDFEELFEIACNTEQYNYIKNIATKFLIELANS